MSQRYEKFKGPGIIIILMVLVIGVGMFWESMLKDPKKRILNSAFSGRLAKPTEPTLIDPLVEIVKPQEEFEPMVITHIPQIIKGKKMPHPFVGNCINCHLIKGGAAAGTQYKTPGGAALEKISRNVIKLGPPIIPQSQRPHPPAGRCIKCHDIVVQVPKKKKSFIWQ